MTRMRLAATMILALVGLALTGLGLVGVLPGTKDYVQGGPALLYLGLHAIGAGVAFWGAISVVRDRRLRSTASELIPPGAMVVVSLVLAILFPRWAGSYVILGLIALVAGGLFMRSKPAPATVV